MAGRRTGCKGMRKREPSLRENGRKRVVVKITRDERRVRDPGKREGIDERRVLRKR